MSVPARYRRTRANPERSAAGAGAGAELAPDEPAPDDVDAGVGEPEVVDGVEDGVELDVDELSDEELDGLDESLAGVLAVRDAEPPRLSVL